jgi:hypothetical protein
LEALGHRWSEIGFWDVIMAGLDDGGIDHLQGPNPKLGFRPGGLELRNKGKEGLKGSLAIRAASS